MFAVGTHPFPQGLSSFRLQMGELVNEVGRYSGLSDNQLEWRVSVDLRHRKRGVYSQVITTLPH